MIAFVIPMCNEKPTLAPLIEGIAANVGAHAHRIMLVDDGSTDGSYEEACALRERFPQVEVLRFKRNFGKTMALRAAFERLPDDTSIVIMMDADLQDDPKEIPRMLEKLDEGYDLVCGWKQKRHDPIHKTFPSKIYNGAAAFLFQLKLHDINTGFKAMRAEVARSVPLYGDMHRMIAVHAHLQGYRVTEIPVEHHPRRFGESKYGFSRFIKGARDIAAVWWAHHFHPGMFRRKHEAIETNELMR